MPWNLPELPHWLLGQKHEVLLPQRHPQRLLPAVHPALPRLSRSHALLRRPSVCQTPLHQYSHTLPPSAIPLAWCAVHFFHLPGLFASFHAIACSLPPPPTIKIFICVFLLTPQTDRYLAGLPLSFFLFYLFIRDQVNGLRKQLPLCLLHNSALQCLRSITLLYFHCFL